MSRKKYINAYEIVYEYDEKGKEKRKLQYRGEYYEVNLTEQELRTFRLRQFGILVLIILIQLALGFMNNPGSRVLYVILPCVITYFPILFWMMGTLRLPKQKQEFRLEVIGLSFDRIKPMSLLTALLAGIAVLGMIVFLILNRQPEVFKDLLFLVGEAIVFGLALLGHILSKKVQFTQTGSSQAPTQPA